MSLPLYKVTGAVIPSRYTASNIVLRKVQLPVLTATDTSWQYAVHAC